MSNLKNEYKLLWAFFAGQYHQDVWDDFETDEAVWIDYLSSVSSKHLSSLYSQVVKIQKENTEELLAFFNDALNCGGIGFDSADEIIEFLKELEMFILNYGSIS